MNLEVGSFEELRSTLHSLTGAKRWRAVCTLFDLAERELDSESLAVLIDYARGILANSGTSETWCPRRWVAARSPLCRLATRFVFDDIDSLVDILSMRGIRTRAVQLTRRVPPTRALEILKRKQDHAAFYLDHLELWSFPDSPGAKAALSRIMGAGLRHLTLGGRWVDGAWDTSLLEHAHDLNTLELLPEGMSTSFALDMIDSLSTWDRPVRLSLNIRGVRWLESTRGARRASMLPRGSTLELIGLDAERLLPRPLTAAIHGFERLILTDSRLSRETLAVLVESSRESLERVQLDSCVLDTQSGGVLQALEGVPRLRELVLEHTRVVGGRMFVPSRDELDVLDSLTSLERVEWPEQAVSLLGDTLDSSSSVRSDTSISPRDEPSADDVMALLSDDGQLSIERNRGSWSVGRRETSDIVFGDTKVSRKHLRITRSDRHALITYLSRHDARSGMYVRAAPMDEISVMGRAVRVLLVPYHQLERSSVRHRPRPTSTSPPRVVLTESGDSISLSSSITRVGRAVENELRLVAASVSRLHAQILALKGEFVVRDVGSRAGTYINGELVDGLSRPLQDGDTVRFATVEVVFKM